MRNIALIVIFLCSTCVFAQESVTEGTLFAAGKNGKELGACPLKHTAVKADISGFLARVTVTQEFANDFAEPIEAVYTFPLSQNGAVDRMTMRIGDRTVRGEIKRREEARRIYEQAKTDGQTASLLDQERPNVFTQAVANILPGDRIIIEISYVETLKYEDGAYEFVFPMTVGPRYIPASVDAEDARKISPPVAATRSGRDVSIEVALDAGVPVEEIRSTSHEIETVNLSANRARVALRDGETIPNKDFILRYDVTGKRIEDAVLAHKDARGGFFTLILQPPDKFAAEDVTPKEIVFVLDTSGSMSGFPLEKAKEAMMLSLDGLYPHDTFNLITFAGDTSVLFDRPVPATQANLEKARAFLETREGGGGTEMMKAIRTALAPSDAQDHVRIVCFMTDGFVGNETEIIGEVQKHPNARVFSFGIGSSVNRYLLDKIAEQGRGEPAYVALEDDGSKAARKFYERVRAPLLTDIAIDWNGLPVTDVYPNRLNDLFSAKPLILHGRYTRGASGTIRLRGKMSGIETVREIPVSFPDTEAANDVLATLWARRKIDELMNGSTRYDANEEEPVVNVAARTRLAITKLGLDYGLLTNYTSFVAVEEQIRTDGGRTRTVQVPVALPDGMDPANATVSEDAEPPTGSLTPAVVEKLPPPPLKKAESSNITAGLGSGNGRVVNSNQVGIGGGSMRPAPTPAPKMSSSAPKVVSGGVVNGKATNLVRPSYPSAGRAVRASGPVSVQVTIDERGNVISATAVSGHPLLRAAAVQAARSSQFSPTMMSGQPVKTTGVIVYNFAPGQTNATTVSQPAPPVPLSPEERAAQERLEKERLAEQQRLEQERLAEEARKAEEARRLRPQAEKLHFWVFAVFDRLRRGSPLLTANEARFVAGDRASVEVYLANRTPETLEKLRALGFETVSENGPGSLVGTIPLDQLGALAGLDAVRLVLPKIR
ncbi:MAG: TonB family protein [Acidobacteria bacterium]|nr:TonB family protein [Acidobacteriota bacterium]